MINLQNTTKMAHINFKNIFNKNNISNINSFLFALVGFFLPISVAIPNIILSIILILWIYEGNFSNKFIIMKQNREILFAFLIFFFVQVIGLLWTQDLKWGMKIISKNLLFLYPIILITIVKYKHIKYYIYSFLIAMTISEILSYLIWLRIIPPFKSASVYDPTPFMSHISYTPYLSFTFFILLYLLFFRKEYLNKLSKIISILFIITISINVFITGGRAGQVVYFVMLLLFTIIYFKKNILRSFLLSGILILIIFSLAYKNSKIFSNRVEQTICSIKNFKTNKNTDVGVRLVFLINSLKIYKQNPIIGVGTGDFKNQYKIVNEKFSPGIMPTDQPHNMYILEMVQTGILGLFSLLFIFYVQIKLSRKNDPFSPIRLAIPVFFIVINFSDSYLLGHFTTLLFIYFSSFVYKDFSYENK